MERKAWRGSNGKEGMERKEWRGRNGKEGMERKEGRKEGRNLSFQRNKSIPCIVKKME
jgi:hypothetical protein